MTLNEFDKTSREAIRLELIDYAKRHDIGVTKLWKRIAKSLPRDIDFSLSTLQRFLANTRRTEDMNVGAISRFLELDGVKDAEATLGKSLSTYYAAPSEIDYSGTFVTPDEKGYAEPATFEINPGDGLFWRVTVKVPLYDHRVLRGVLANGHGTAVLTLKDALTGSPAVYVLKREGNQLAGHGIRSPFSNGVTTDRSAKLSPLVETIETERQVEVHGT